MRRVWHPYWLWEDYERGLYADSETFDAHMDASAELLADPLTLEAAMRAAVDAYPYSAEHNLTASEGRRSWLGQAACFYKHGSPEACTRVAWWTLTDEQRAAANEAADRVADDYEKARDGAQTLFG